MTRAAKIVFFLLTALSIAATVEPFSLYTMSTIHVLRIERWFVGLVCLAAVAFTLLIWCRKRWALAPAVASDILFGLWYLYALAGTIRGHNYLCWHCLIIPFAWAFSAFVAAGILIVLGGKYCRGASPTTRFASSPFCMKR